jgi:hypothetical protein
MKFKLPFLLSILCGLIVVGCVTSEPVVYEDPPGSGNEVTGNFYATDPQLEALKQKVLLTHDNTAPLNPYATLTRPVLEGGFMIAASLSALVAALKNRKLKTALSTVVQGVDSAPDPEGTKAAIGKIAEVKGTSAVTKSVVNTFK